jgi:hypothetical protein
MASRIERDAEGHIMGGRARIDGLPVEYGGLGTMSKSKLNGVDPQDMIDRFGADAARLFVMFAAPPEATLEWSDAGVEGAHRFVRRLWVFAQTQKGAIADAAGAFDWNVAAASVKAARRDVHLALKQANYDYERIQYNTVVSAGMKMLNALEGIPIDASGGAELVCEGMSILIRVLYPVVPHIGCALWDELGFAGQNGSLLDAAWPEVDPAALAQDQIELVLQINGKLRGKLMVPASATPRRGRSGGACRSRGRQTCGRQVGEKGHRGARRDLSMWSFKAIRPRCNRGPRHDRDRRLRLPPSRRGQLSIRYAVPQCADGAATFHGRVAAGDRRQSNHKARRRRHAAQVILDITSVVDDKQVLSLSGGGRVREYSLAKRVLFSVHDANGADWLPAAELVIRRTYSFNESEVLAREAQELRLLAEMQTDAVQQILRRLQAAKKPTG